MNEVGQVMLTSRGMIVKGILDVKYLYLEDLRPIVESNSLSSHQSNQASSLLTNLIIHLSTLVV